MRLLFIFCSGFCGSPMSDSSSSTDSTAPAAGRNGGNDSNNNGGVLGGLSSDIVGGLTSLAGGIIPTSDTSTTAKTTRCVF